MQKLIKLSGLEHQRLSFTLISLLAIDVALIVLYLAFRIREFMHGSETPELLKFEGALTIPSYWLYLKLLLTAFVLFALSRTYLKQGFAVVASFFALLFLYDYFVEYPEDTTEIPEPFFGEVSLYGLRAINLDEIFQISIILIFAVFAFAYSLKRTDSINKRFVRHLILLVVLLAVFGVGFDMIHLLADGLVAGRIGLVVEALLGLLEDGGEMIVGSLILGWQLYVSLTYASRVD